MLRQLEHQPCLLQLQRGIAAAARCPAQAAASFTYFHLERAHESQRRELENRIGWASSPLTRRVKRGDRYLSYSFCNAVAAK